MLYGILTAASALLLASALAAATRVPALRLGLAERRRARGVPLSGGVALVAATGAVAGAGAWAGGAPLGAGDGGRLLLAALGLAVLGLAADLRGPRGLPFRIRVAGIAVAAAVVVPYDEIGLLLALPSIGWIVLVVHAFKGLGRCDGALGAVGIVTAFTAAACAAAEVMDGLAALLSVLAAALTGVLMHNWPPARVLIGECGALFAGFLIAGGVVLVQGAHGGAGPGVPFALTAMVSADAVLVLVARHRAGRPLWRSAPDHLAHRLRRLGLTAQGAVVVLGATTLASAFVGLAVHMLWMGPAAALWVAAVAAVTVLGLLRVPVYGDGGTRRAGTGGTRRAGADSVRKVALPESRRPRHPRRPARPRHPHRLCPLPSPTSVPESGRRQSTA
ncbi:undecaprenyl/decaprenyl-phosphate alpha-N-acetylglucosaminyl 1-phosphate transferase [Streptomyces poonensis]|uniref:Glycosyltransferase n=1 Tax=Streptomyces poonensis TaxID=68255 RepID=A0A918PJG0_9ACTN|nr:undecaprenyl/decaprenyl-phosphate alpha-N-acetylglucosaminyl 1-phosphate transferase [Streptomyces poonensis]GGZ13034.1 putative glycosyltransferase [Streptomyces poonensis]GLJ91943.1 putative glycosyltransferase [Streptomyces poonensis]